MTAISILTVPSGEGGSMSVPPAPIPFLQTHVRTFGPKRVPDFVFGLGAKCRKLGFPTRGIPVRVEHRTPQPRLIHAPKVVAEIVNVVRQFQNTPTIQPPPPQLQPPPRLIRMNILVNVHTPPIAEV